MHSSARQAGDVEPTSSTPEEPGAYRPSLGLARWPGWRGELLILAVFLLAACVLTWPLPVTLGKAVGTRPDYLNNLWNAWWLEHCISVGHTPFWTDHLYFPEGISLKRHTLSLLNALGQVGLRTFLDGHQAFSLMVLLHFALSGWCFSLLARYVSGSTAGGVLGGLVYSFCPFHYFYLCQINVFSFEFLPLALLFLLRHAREGGGRNLLGIVLALAALTATVEYYVVYAYLGLAVLALCARGWARAVPRGLLVRRLVVGAGLGAVAIVLAGLPLLWATFGPEGRADLQTSANAVEATRTNDLLGFFWLGGDEECTVSWPTMLGYSTLLLLLAGWRRVRAHWPWLVVALTFLVLSLGGELSIGRQKTGIPLPYALFEDLPLFSMLRKSDRCFMMVQLAVGVLLAGAWSGLAARLTTTRARRTAWVLAAGLTMTELTAVPLGRFELPVSPELARLRDEADVQAVMELPAQPQHTQHGRYDYFQTVHEKKSTLGYTTSIALTPLQDQRKQTLVNLYLQFINEQNRVLPRFAASLGVDRLLHYKTLYDGRPRDPELDGVTLWKPFFFWRKPLVYIRQVGEYVEVPYPPQAWDRIRLLLSRALGAPLFEDEYMAVFKVEKGS